ncbi:hypothetical protein [Sphingomicrobium flavum]|uniref:hypothetical protein n=1 Tax=Sphingomicrobium flavum TaxID=1229164 RepID=UPI0021ADBFA9|nr:hypothetical protein [Sphingomicrobium flavum]
MIDEVAGHLIRAKGAGPLRVAIDGRTAAGKTSFREELAKALRAEGHDVVATSIDGFHHPKVVRYAKGRTSADGYYEDARNLPAIRRLLLDPLGADGNRHYAMENFDLEADQPIEPVMHKADEDVILLVDGTFLQRPELKDGFDLTIFLDVPQDLAVERAAVRAGAENADAMRTAYATRYLPAYERYDRECRPMASADLIIDNRDFEKARVVDIKGTLRSGVDA